MKNYLMAMATVSSVLVVATGANMMIANSQTIEELEKSNARNFTYQEELVDKDSTIENLNNIIDGLNEVIAEQDDDIKSLEVQYEKEISQLEEECDQLTLLYAKEKKALMATYESMLTDDQQYLAEYVANGGEIEDIGVWKCTAYCTEKYRHICGTGSGITASGEPVQANVSVAVNKSNLSWLPFGTQIYIEGVGIRTIMDTGGGVATNQFDCANGTHSEALKWSGAGNHRAWILK